MTQYVELGVNLDHDLLDLDHEVTGGIVIVGEAQAGKTTFMNIVTEEWGGIDGRPVYKFSNSDGFRGLTAHVLSRSGVSLDTAVDPATYDGMLGDFGAEIPDDELLALLDGCYSQPAAKEILRSRAVNSVVATTSEHPDVRQLVNAAGSRRMMQVLQQPHLENFAERPGLVVLDARNQGECLRKFDAAGVVPLGTFVLTCSETVAAKRILRGRGGDEAIYQEAARLAQRNETDRRRPVGAMTCPDDLHPVISATEAMWSGGVALIEAGAEAARNRTAGIVVETDEIDLNDEKYIAKHVLMGAVMELSRQSTAAMHA